MRFYLAIVVQGEDDVVVVFPVFKALFYQTLVEYKGYANIIVESPPETSDTRRSMERRACLLV